MVYDTQVTMAQDVMGLPIPAIRPLIAVLNCERRTIRRRVLTSGTALDSSERTPGVLEIDCLTELIDGGCKAVAFFCCMLHRRDPRGQVVCIPCDIDTRRG